MAKTVYLSEQGDDKNDGLTDETPVRTAAKAVKTSIKFGAQGILRVGERRDVRAAKRRTGGGTQKGDETLIAPSSGGKAADKTQIRSVQVLWTSAFDAVNGSSRHASDMDLGAVSDPAPLKCPTQGD